MKKILIMVFILSLVVMANEKKSQVEKISKPKIEFKQVSIEKAATNKMQKAFGQSDLGADRIQLQKHDTKSGQAQGKIVPKLNANR